MKSPALIRLATLEDLPAISALIDASVRGLSGGFLTPDEIEGQLRFVIAPDSQLVTDRTYYVATHPDAVTEGGLVASGGWSGRRALHGGDAYKARSGPDADALLVPGQDPARIRAMFVHPSWARRGLGRAIFETARAAAEAAGFRALVLTATLPGVPLYETLGFRAVRRYDERLPDGSAVPMVEMERAIQSSGLAQ